MALYAILAAKGFFPEDWLDASWSSAAGSGRTPIARWCPGIEASTGSLGHGLPMAVGVAQALRAKGLAEKRVVVLCGDAELNEGSNWEAITLAPELGLANLTLLVIDNHSAHRSSQRRGRTVSSSFAWNVHEVDGHDREALERAFLAPSAAPLAVVADVPAGEW